MNGRILTLILLSVIKFSFAEQQKNICGRSKVSNCQYCPNNKCKWEDLTSASAKTDYVCYWNDYRDRCLPNRGLLISSEI